jgi:hypothetical protein
MDVGNPQQCKGLVGSWDHGDVVSIFLDVGLRKYTVSNGRIVVRDSPRLETTSGEHKHGNTKLH